MIDDMNNRITSFLMRGQIPVQVQQEQPVQEAAPVEQQAPRYKEQKDNFDEMHEAQRQAANQDTRERPQQRHEPIVHDKMPRPNDPCPCGSGKKFKNCHGKGLR